MDNELEYVEVNEVELALIEAGVEILSDIVGEITGAANVDELSV